MTQRRFLVLPVLTMPLSITDMHPINTSVVLAGNRLRHVTSVFFTSLGRFIRSIRTIDPAITAMPNVNTPPIRTLELVLLTTAVLLIRPILTVSVSIAFVDPQEALLPILALQLVRLAFQVTIRLVTPIVTVQHSIALCLTRNTLSIPRTLVLRLGTIPPCTAHLVAIIPAIVVLVASPVLRDALRILALETVLRALQLVRAVSLVPTIHTIPFSVTNPRGRNTSTRRTLIILRQTLLRLTVPFIGSVRTIAVSVALPELWNTQTRSASPLTGTTRGHRTILFVLSVRTVLHFVALLLRSNTERRLVGTLPATELGVETGEVVTGKFIRPILTVLNAVTNQTRVNARLVLALELPRFAVERWTVR